MSKQSSPNWGLAFLIGIGMGYVASLFVSDKTRDEHKKVVTDRAQKLEDILLDKDQQERVREIFKKNSTQATALYEKAQKLVVSDLVSATSTLSEINKAKYTKAVTSAIDTLTREQKMPKVQVARLKRYLEKDYLKVKKAISKEA